MDENEEEDSDSEQDSEENPQVTSLASKRRKKRLSPYEVSEIIVETGIKTLRELQALAFEQKETGKTDLAEFLITRSPKVVADILNSAWDIQAAPKKLACVDCRETVCDPPNNIELGGGGRGKYGHSIVYL